ncbi:porin family protein [Pedobacter cryoconitis]|nr:outer membrane beta-barrel protein [Pedobacter cryoconitis]
MKRFLLGLLLGTSAICSAQSNFQKGYVVNDLKDTLRGYVDYKEWRKNPSSVTFKVGLDTDAQIFTVDRASAWSVDGFESYQRHEVEISMSKIDLDRLSAGLDQSKIKSTVFLQVLQTGKNVTLYSYTDGIKRRFYLQGNDDPLPYELSSQRYMKSGQESIVIKETGYIRQLSLVMNKLNAGTADELKRLAFLPYKEEELMNIVAIINEQKLAKPKTSAIRFFAGTGLNVFKAVYKGNIAFAQRGAVIKTSYSPLVTAGIDILANPAIGKLIYRLESSLLMSKNEASIDSYEYAGSNAQHTFDQVTITFLPQLIYNIYNANHLKAFVGAGIGVNFSSYSNNRTSQYNSITRATTRADNAIDMEKFNFSLPFTAGVVFNKKIEVSAGYAFSSSITNYSNFSINMQRYRIGVNYLFGKL